MNFGGISVGGIGPNRKLFGGLDADFLPHTQLAENKFSRGMPEHGAELADRLLELIALHDASNIAAVIVEPFSGSAGVVVPPKGYLKRLRDICTAHDILLIFDEVITGFGRAGAMTGADAFGVVPDIMNFAKQVTNGVQPLGGVIATKEIYDTFMAAGGRVHARVPARLHVFGAPGRMRGGRRGARPAVEGRRGGPRARSRAAFRSRGAWAEGPAPHHRHPQLRAGSRPDDRGAAGRAGTAPVRDRDALLGEGLHVRYGGDTIQLAPRSSPKREIDNLVNALSDALNEVD